MLRSTLMIGFALVFAAPAVAGGPSFTGSGTYEGERFEYTSRLAEGDKIRIDGKFVRRGEQFTYVVKPSGLVEGFVGNTAVNFHVSRAKRDRIVAQLKAGSEPAFAEARVGTTTAR